MSYSVVVPTYCRPAKLNQCLCTLLEQSILPGEVLVVDDDSPGQATHQVCLDLDNLFQQKNINLRYLKHSKNRGPAAARNTGLRSAVFETVFFTDDDCILPTEWASNHIRTHECHVDAAAVHGWYTPKAGKNIYDEYEEVSLNLLLPDFFTSEIYGDSPLVPLANTANLSVKKSILEKAQVYFDESIVFTGNEDFEFSLSINQKGLSRVHIPFCVIHDRVWDLRSYIKAGVLRGRGHDYCVQKYFFGRGRKSLFAFVSVALFKSFEYGSRRLHLVFLLTYLSHWLGKTVNVVANFKPPQPLTFGIRVSSMAWKKEGLIIRKHEWHPFYAAHRYSNRPPSTGNTFCSVIVPTYDRSSLLKLQLPYILNQSISAERYEIIIVDDGSTDDTEEVVSDLVKRNPTHTIRYIYQKNHGAAAARNAGAKISKGDLLIFIDSDVVPDRHWISDHVYAHSLFPEISAAGGGQIVEAENATIFDKHRNSLFCNQFAKRYPYSTLITNNTFQRVHAFDTGNLSIKKNALESLGGFDEDLLRHQDMEFGFRLQNSGRLVALLPITVKSIRSTTFRDFIDLVRKQAISYPILFQKIKPLPKESLRIKNSIENYGILMALLNFLFNISTFGRVYLIEWFVLKKYYKTVQSREGSNSNNHDSSLSSV